MPFLLPYSVKSRSCLGSTRNRFFSDFALEIFHDARFPGAGGEEPGCRGVRGSLCLIKKKNDFSDKLLTPHHQTQLGCSHSHSIGLVTVSNLSLQITSAPWETMTQRFLYGY